MIIMDTVILDTIAGILIIIALASTICGIILPTLKRRRCTFTVNATISDRKKAGTDIGNGIDTEADRVTLHYFYNGNNYQKRMNVEPDAKSVQILVNTNNPKEFVRKTSKYYWLGVVSNILVTAIMLFGAIYIGLNF